MMCSQLCTANGVFLEHFQQVCIDGTKALFEFLHAELAVSVAIDQFEQLCGLCIPIWSVFCLGHLAQLRGGQFAISVSVSAKALLAYHAAARANASKLPANPLAFLAEMGDERIRRMQEQLLHYRWAMAYRRPAAPSAVHSIAQELQEHVSQNPVRQS